MRYSLPPLSKLGLWPRVGLAVSAGFGTLFLAFFLLSERALQETSQRLLDQRLVVAQIAAAQVDSLLGQGFTALELPVRHADLDSASSALDNVANILDDEGQLSMFSPGFVLLDPNGHSILSRPNELYPAGMDLSSQPHVSDAVNHGRVTISDPFDAPLTGHSVVALTVPLLRDGRIFGFLSGLIDLRADSFIGPLVKATTLSESEHAAVIDKQGRVVVSTFFIEPLSSGEHHEFYLKAMATDIPTVETVPFEMDLPGEPLGHLHIMALAPLNNAPWGVAVGGDEVEIFSGVRQLRSGLLILGVSSLIGVWFITLLGTRRLVKPVQELTDSANQIAAGDLSVPLSVSSGGEIGLMASALDNMRNQLLDQIKELDRWNETLESRVKANTEDLRRQQTITEQLLGRLIHAQEDERKRVARELHDEIGQTLTAVELSLDHLANALPPENEVARRRLERSRTLTQKTVADLRPIIGALRPAVLDQLGLVPALNWMSDHTLRQDGVIVTINADKLDERLPVGVETTLFRIAQEAMSNVSRHSQAASLAITLERKQESVKMTLQDDGRGFVPDAFFTEPDPDLRMGIASMQERVMLLKGTLTIDSAPGRGTLIGVTIPLNSEVEPGREYVEQVN